jgi:parallel beta-helix repeat protein
VIRGEKSKILYKDQTAILRLFNVSNVTIRDLRIDANGANWTSDGLYVLSIMGSTDVTIADNEIYNGYGAGIVVSQTPGVPLGTNKNFRILIEGNYIHDIGDNTGAESWKYGNGVAVVLGEDVIIRNNFIDNIARVGAINLEGQGMYNILIEGNIVSNTLEQAAAIQMYKTGADIDAENVVIRDNLLYDLSLDEYTGGPDIPPAIYIQAGGRGIRVEGNRIYNAKARGIVVDRSNDILISGNIIQLSPKAGIQCATAFNAKVINNQVEVPNDGTNSTNARIYVQMPTDGTGTAVITGNTIVNAPFEAFNLAGYGAPFVFTGNTIVNCRLAGTLGAGVTSFTAFYASVIGNNTIFDSVGSYASRFVGFYNLSSVANADLVVLPDGWKIADTTLVKYALPATPVFFQTELALSTAAPTAGYNSQGRIVWKSNAASGGTPGWMCTAAGTPGTWTAMANLT